MNLWEWLIRWLVLAVGTLLIFSFPRGDAPSDVAELLEQGAPFVALVAIFAVFLWFDSRIDRRSN